MVAAGFIHQDRETNLYTMSRDHQEVLKTQSAFSSVIPVFAARTELLKNCFKKEGPYGIVSSINTSIYSFHTNAVC